MRVVIARHGKAFQDSMSGLDRDRLLKPRGEHQADYLGSALAETTPRPTRVVASPYVRAWQTAQRLARGLGLDPVEDRRLVCGRNASDLIDILEEAAHAALDAVCIIGHNPTLEVAIGALLEGPTGEPVRVRTGEAFCLDVDPTHPVNSAVIVAQLRLAD
ncbi:MAG: histidine phosphatase family protein [Phycisphaerales bacterium]|nr:histidine phosphatase family protein [Phycisphaeraceae bacterium]